MRARTLSVIGLIALTAGCWKATIETGLRPSGDVIKNEWAHSFVYGLVPPATVETMARCPNGVARVQTQHSFLNGLVQVLTWGLYAPITIEVQCAAPREEEAQTQALVVPAGASTETAARIVGEAATRARDQQQPVLVRFE